MPTDDLPTQSFVAGESFEFNATVTEDGSAKDITGATPEWWLLPEQGAETSEALLSESDSEVTVALTTDGSDGRVDITVAQGATDDLAGQSHWQRIHVDDTGDGLQKWGGVVYFEEP